MAQQDQGAMREALRFFGIREPRRMILGAALFVAAAALMIAGGQTLRFFGGALWLVAAFVAIRGWFRAVRARPAERDDPERR